MELIIRRGWSADDVLELRIQGHFAANTWMRHRRCFLAVSHRLGKIQPIGGAERGWKRSGRILGCRETRKECDE